MLPLILLAAPGTHAADAPTMVTLVDVHAVRLEQGPSNTLPYLSINGTNTEGKIDGVVIYVTTLQHLDGSLRLVDSCHDQAMAVMSHENLSFRVVAHHDDPSMLQASTHDISCSAFKARQPPPRDEEETPQTGR